MEAQTRSTDGKNEGEGLKVDMNDIFSLRRPRDCGAGLSSGLKSAAKVGFVTGHMVVLGKYISYDPGFNMQNLNGQDADMHGCFPTGHRRRCCGPVCLTGRYVMDLRYIMHMLPLP